MKRLIALALLASLGLARVEVTNQPVVIVPFVPVITVSAPVITINTEFRISLIPNLVVIERVPEPTGVVVVYRSSNVANVYGYHHRDLSQRGWVRVKYQAKNGRYKSEYRRGKARAKLEVWDKRGRVEVKVREG